MMRTHPQMTQMNADENKLEFENKSTEIMAKFIVLYVFIFVIYG